MKINEIIHHLEPDEQTIINNMIERYKLNGDATIEQLVTACPYTNPDIPRDERIALVSLVHKRPNRFAQKLDFAKRCEILALHRMGIRREVLAAMYEIDRRTIAHVYTATSPHYKNVREEEIKLGRERFIKTYATDDILNKALAFTVASSEDNNKYASHKAGVHAVRNHMCEYDHRVEIQWREDEGREPGWYYRDLDGDDPVGWYRGHDNESLKTSQACYTAMMSSIYDKELA